MVIVEENKDKTRYCVHVEPKEKIREGSEAQFHACRIKQFMKREEDRCIGSLYTDDCGYKFVEYNSCTVESCPLFTTDCESGERANLAVKLMAK